MTSTPAVPTRCASCSSTHADEEQLLAVLRQMEELRWYYWASEYEHHFPTLPPRSSESWALGTGLHCQYYYSYQESNQSESPEE